VIICREQFLSGICGICAIRRNRQFQTAAQSCPMRASPRLNSAEERFTLRWRKCRSGRSTLDRYHHFEARGYTLRCQPARAAGGSGAASSIHSPPVVALDEPSRCSMPDRVSRRPFQCVVPAFSASDAAPELRSRSLEDRVGSGEISGHPARPEWSPFTSFGPNLES